ETIAQTADACQFAVHLFACDAEGFAHTDDLVRRQRARTQTALVTAAMHLRLDTHARLAAHVQSTNTLRTIGLVRRKTHQIDLGLFEIDLDLASRLRGVAVKNDALATAQLTDLIDRLDHANLVVDQHHRNQDGIGTDRIG